MPSSGGALAREPLRGFVAGATAQPSKKSVMKLYELGPTAVADQARLNVKVGWTPAEQGLPHDTLVPSYARQELLDASFPFVKRALLEQLRFTP